MKSFVNKSIIGLTLLATVLLAVPQAHASYLVATDVAAQAGIARITNDQYGSNVVFDYNGDGISDLVLGNHLIAPAEVFRGNADGTFTKVQELSLSDRHGCTSADFNGDGKPDLYCAVGANHGTSNSKSNELWLQDVTGTFIAVPGAGGANDPTGRGRAVQAFDANNDGLADIFVGNGYPNQYPSPDRLFINIGAAQFTEDTRLLPKAYSGGICVTTADFNGDGWQDVYVCGSPDHLYMSNRDGSYSDVARTTAALGTNKSSGAQWGDMNGDGRPDLVIIGSTSLTVWLNNGTKLTKSYSHSLLAGRKVALADVDGDGTLDIYAVQGRQSQTSGSPNQPDLLLMNAGNGTYFSAFAGLPQATSGAGSNVGVIPNYNGHPAFVVTNGGDGTKTFKGPRQLITFN